MSLSNIWVIKSNYDIEVSNENKQEYNTANYLELIQLEKRVTMHG